MVKASLNLSSPGSAESVHVCLLHTLGKIHEVQMEVYVCLVQMLPVVGCDSDPLPWCITYEGLWELGQTYLQQHHNSGALQDGIPVILPCSQ